MKLRLLCLLLAFFGLLNLSAYSNPHYAGLLTDSYGIITLDDFESPEQLSPESHFPDNEFENYWQCLEPEEYFLDCENTGRILPEDYDAGAATFWIRANGKRYHFGTRRNWDIEFCQDMVSGIRKIMENEPIACVYASYLSSDDKDSVWIIDRVKTRKGEWSWFARPGEE